MQLEVKAAYRAQKMRDSSQAEPIDSGETNLWQPPAWVPPAVLVAIGVIMLSWNPDGWVHPLVDYGRELYVPWRLTEGEVLYRDIAYFNGPLSPYLNALWFQVFGVSMHVLTVVNVAIAAGACALLYRLLFTISDRFTATITGAIFLFFFVFQHIDYRGTFNWIGPYSHEMTHGMALTLLMVWMLSRHLRAPSTSMLAGVGLLLGLIFLTKPEIFIAAGLTTDIAICSDWYRRRQSLRQLLREAAIATAAVFVAPLLAFGLLASAMSAGDAITGVCGGWIYVFQEELTSLRFYAVGRGTDDIALSLTRIAEGLGWYSAFLVPGAFLAWGLRKSKIRSAYLGFGLAGAIAFSPIIFPTISQVVSIRPVLVFTLTIGLVLAWKFRASRDPIAMQGLVLCALALALLPKIILNVRFVHYGFGLAFPATLLSVIALLYWIPRDMNRRGWAGGVFRGVGVGMLMVIFLSCLQYVDRWIGEKTLVTGGEHEKLRSRNTELSAPADHAIRWLLKNTKPTDTVLVLPEGISINYFSRRVNPTGQINFMPPEIIMYGEPQVLSQLQAHAPDYCVVIHRETQEYDLPLFGTDYGQSIMSWVGQNYQAVDRLGEEPLHQDRLKDNKPGMLIMQRR